MNVELQALREIVKTTRVDVEMGVGGGEWEWRGAKGGLSFPPSCKEGSVRGFVRGSVKRRGGRGGSGIGSGSWSGEGRRGGPSFPPPVRRVP